MKRVLTVVSLIGLMGMAAWAQNGAFNGDGAVDYDDFFLFADHFGITSESPNWDAAYSLDDDGDVDFDDFFVLANLFNSVDRTDEPDYTIEGTGRILYLSDRDGTTDIYSMNPDGTDQRKFLPVRPWPHEGVSIKAFSLSPDGSKLLIVFEDRVSQKKDLKIDIANNSIGPSLYPGYVAWSPNSSLYPGPVAWSPDGIKIAFIGHNSDGQPRIVIRSSDWELITVFDFGSTSPSWSPDGTKIAYNYYSGIWVHDFESGRSVDITPSKFGYCSSPAWSPEGERIVFSSFGIVDNPEPKYYNWSHLDLFSMDPNGMNVTRLTDFPSVEDTPWSPGGSSEFWFYSSWSPDGRYLLFRRDNDIFVMRSDGDQIIPLTSDSAKNYSPVWTPHSIPYLTLDISSDVPEAARLEFLRLGYLVTQEGLYMAASEGDISTISLFLDAGMTVDARSNTCRDTHCWTPTALAHAVMEEHIDTVEFLLERGANPNLDAGFGVHYPLMSAADDRNLEIARLLIQHGADVNASNIDDITPLLIAAEEGYFEFVRLLLENGADPNVISGHSYYRDSPLIKAAEAGHVDIVEILIQYGAQIDAVGGTNLFSGGTALSRAASGGQKATFFLLLEHWPKPDVRSLLGIFKQSRFSGSLPFASGTWKHARKMEPVGSQTRT